MEIRTGWRIVAQIVVGATTALWGVRYPKSSAQWRALSVRRGSRNHMGRAECRNGDDSSHHIEGTGTIRSGRDGD